MKITNNLNLPKQLVELVDNNYKPTPHQYSCTTILKPTRQIILERRYTDEIEQDVSDMCWMIFGIAVHSVIENSKESDGQFKEEKLKVDLGKYWEELKGYYLSGRSDMIDLIEKKITDWKTCSAWKIIFKDFEDWKKEMLIYAWAVKDMGFDIDKSEAIAFIKDHNKTKSKIDSNYPKLPIWVEKFKFTEKEFESIKEFIYKKFIELKNNETVEDDPEFVNINELVNDEDCENNENNESCENDKNNEPDFEKMTPNELRDWARENGFGREIRNIRSKEKLLEIVRG